MFTFLGASSVLLVNRIVLAATGDELLPAWGQLGIAGMLIVLFLTDRIVTGAKYNQVVNERNAERARTELVEGKLEEKFLPAMLQTQAVLKTVDDQIIPLLKEIRDYLENKRAERG